MMISLIQPEDEDFKEYRIKISDFIDLLGLKGNSVHGNLKKILTQLRQRTLSIEKMDSNDYVITGWIDTAGYSSSDGAIFLSFSPTLKPYLLQVKNKFLSLKLDSLLRLKSIYSIRIYTLLKQYEKIGKREFSISELREILGINKEKYPIYSEFKRNVILKAKKELDFEDKNGLYKSDISFFFFEVKTGRKVTGLIFEIKKQKTPKQIKIKSFNSKSLDMLLAYGVSESKAVHLAGLHSVEEVENCISIFEDKKNKKQIKNNGLGLLIKLIEDGAGKQKTPQKTIPFQEESYDDDKLEKERNKLAKEYDERARLHFIESLPLNKESELIDQACKHYNSDILDGIIRKNGIETPLVKAYILTLLKNHEENKEKYISEKLKK